MQPAEPMAVPKHRNNFSNNQEIPEHLPAQTALAPEQQPYENTRTVRQQDFEHESHNIANHSLSPSELGVVGYVRDVACFVKDAVKERRMHRKENHNNNSAPMSTSPPPMDHRGRITESTPKSPTPSNLSSSPGEQAREPTPLAEAVTNLFPGLDPHAVGCTHADELRHDLMRTHSRESTDSPRLLNE
ncbi:hypothetical protein BDA99DRAFT_529878 [Phascolomyces articulosus]|uniref:Uncharacterized protein n=1 Tax=Phascolomyces articulosus TaxID=60185 RepID=A0AAD5JLM1_9FUNG|nr:hypothetical protein BDA99DRAFT_529878 [Phascolomyces articulosus]